MYYCGLVPQNRQLCAALTGMESAALAAIEYWATLTGMESAALAAIESALPAVHVFDRRDQQNEENRQR